MTEFTETKTPYSYVDAFFDPSGITNFAVLKLSVNPENPELINLYKTHVAKHNHKIATSQFPDAGFDLFVPSTTFFETPFETHFLDLQVKTEMLYTYAKCDPADYNTDASVQRGDVVNTGFKVYPRSSMSKMPLMLANHTGIIDSGYRGNLIAALRYLNTTTDRENPNIYELEAQTRIVQICHPELLPIFVVMVDESELSTTARGRGGFGSTGLKGAL
jgi:dUTPase